MRKLSIGLAILTLLALSLIPVSAGTLSAPFQQVTTSDLLTFADSAPYAAPLYVSLRLDSGYIETLDGLIAQIGSALPPNVLPPEFSISALLDVVSQTITGADFAEGLRPLVGNTGAIALGSLDGTLDYNYNNDTPPVAVYLSITDRSTTTALLESILNEQFGAGSVERRDSANATTFTIAFIDATLVISSDTLVASTSSDMIVPANEASLADYVSFVDTIGALPAESYNALAYVDVAYFGSVALGSNRYMRFQDRAAQLMVFRSLGTWAAGVATLDGGTLAVDLAVRPGNLTGLESLGFDVTGDYPPVNSELLARLPADTALAWHGSNVGGVIDFARRNLDGIADIFTRGLLDEATVDDLLDSALAIPNMFITNLSGLTPDGLSTWLTGDYLIAVKPNMNYFVFDYATGLPFDFGIILQASDAAASRESMALLARDLSLAMRSLNSGQSGLAFSEGRIGDADALIISVTSYNYASSSYAEFDFVLAADDGVLVFGVRDFVESVLANAGNTESPFDGVQATLLADSRVNLYANPVPLMGLITTSTFYSPQFDRLRYQLPQMLIPLLDSATGSLTFDEAGNTIVRFTITLSENREDNAAAASATYEAFAAMATARFSSQPTRIVPTTVPFNTPTFTPTAFVPTIPPTPTAFVATPTASEGSGGGVIEIGDTINGTLAASEIDNYLFTTQAGTSVLITMESDDFDTYLEVRNASGSLLDFNDDRGAGDLNSELVFTAPFDGTFQVIARGYSGFASGDYTISMTAATALATPTRTFTPTFVPTTAPNLEGSIDVGDTVEGTIPRGGRVLYEINLAVGDSYTIDLSSSEFDTVIEVYSSSGSQVGFNDDFSGTNSRLSNFTVSSSGTYTLLVRSFADAGGGDYVLSVTRTAAPTATATAVAVTGTVLSYGQKVDANLPLGQRQNYTFEGRAGDVVTIEMEAAFDTYLRLLDASGTQVAFNDDRGDGTYNSEISRFVLPNNGTYTIVAGSYNDNGSGAYTLILARS